MDLGEIDVRPISDADADAVCDFLHHQLNPRVPAEAWNALLAPPWQADAPNHGFQLVVGATVVGVYVAVYSERRVDGQRRRFCNLAAFCVRPDYRSHGFRLLRAILAQKGLEFTDLSPSGNVVALNKRLGFALLDTATRVAPNLPRLPRRGLTVTDDPAIIAGILDQRDVQVYRDHRNAPAARHIVAIAGAEYSYLVVRKDRRKRLPFFVSALYVGGSGDLLRSAWPQIASHLLLRHGALATLAERRILGFLPRFGRDQRAPRAKMFRSEVVPAEAIDYLYSELTLLSW
jgi:GNAT superfamily N-acetyltransferase